MVDKRKIEELCLTPYSFVVYNEKDAAQKIFINMVRHYLKSFDDVKIDLIVEGDSLRGSSFPKRVVSRFIEELEEVDPITQAVYDFIIDVYDMNNHKLATFTNEMVVSYDKNERLNVSCKNMEYRWHKDPSVDRFASMDYTDNSKSSQNKDDIDDSIFKRFYNLEFDRDGVEISNKPKRYRIKKQELINLQNYLGDTCDAYMKIRNRIADDDFIIYDRIMQKSLDEIRDFVSNFPKSDKVLNPPDKQRKPRSKSVDKTTDRFANLDYNCFRRNTKMSKLHLRRLNEAQLQLIQTQDQELDQKQKLKQKTTLQSTMELPVISKSVQKMADTMSYQAAYDALEETYKKWEESDTYNQYQDTIKKATHWYRGDQYFVNLVNSFQGIEDLYRAAEIIRQLQKIEKDISLSKSRAKTDKLNKEKDVLRRELDTINEALPTYNVSSDSADILTAQADMLKEKEREYTQEYKKNISEWEDMFGKLDKLKKQVELMDALRIKYITDRNDIKSILPKYKDLVDSTIPAIIDIRDLDDVHPEVAYTAWDVARRDYMDKLDAFNTAFKECYDVLAPILAVKAKSRSLF